MSMIFRYHSRIRLSSSVLRLARSLLLTGLLLAFASAAYGQGYSNDALREANEELERELQRQQVDQYDAESPSETQQDSSNEMVPEAKALPSSADLAKPSTAHQTDGVMGNIQSFIDRFREISNSIEGLLPRETINPAVSNQNGGGYNAAQGGQGDTQKEGGEGESEEQGQGDYDKDDAYGYDKDIATERSGEAKTSAHTVGSGKNSIPRRPEDVGSGHDDSAAAKILREAAQAEKDPAIRAKIWDEYRKYKKEGR